MHARICRFDDVIFHISGLYTLDGEKIEYGPMQAVVQPHSEACVSVMVGRPE